MAPTWDVPVLFFSVSKHTEDFDLVKFSGKQNSSLVF